jgi:hypothetical protein
MYKIGGYLKDLRVFQSFADIISFPHSSSHMSECVTHKANSH